MVNSTDIENFILDKTQMVDVKDLPSIEESVNNSMNKDNNTNNNGNTENNTNNQTE